MLDSSGRGVGQIVSPVSEGLYFVESQVEDIESAIQGVEERSISNMLGIDTTELRFAYSLHVVEAVEEGSHQSLYLLKEDWQFLLHGVVEVLVVCTGSLELLLKLEKVLLILK